MNDTELINNYFIACVHYAQLNDSGNLPLNSSFVSLEMNGPSLNDLTITLWNHSTSQPNTAILQAYTLNDINITSDRWLRHQAKIGENTIPNGSYSAYLNGPWSGSQNITIDYTVEKGRVTLDFPMISVSGNNSSSHISSLTYLPIYIRPPVTKSWPIVVKNDGTGQFGCLDIDTSGNITIMADATGSTFSSGTGNYGINATSVSYNL